MNWGKKIAVAYLGFVAFMGCMVWLCVKQDDIHLVSKDYYQQEIAYQERIDSRSNAEKLSGKLRYQYHADTKHLSLSWPEEVKGASGKIQFYRPSDARKDFSKPLETTGLEQEMPLEGLTPGLWVLKTSWEKNGKHFYQEDKIVF